MPALPTTPDALRGLVSKTTQSIATASASTSAALRKALARLVNNGGTQQGPERRTR